MTLPARSANFSLSGRGRLERLQAKTRQRNPRDRYMFPTGPAACAAPLGSARDRPRARAGPCARWGISRMPRPLTSILPARVAGARGESSRGPSASTTLDRRRPAAARSRGSPASARKRSAKVGLAGARASAQQRGLAPKRHAGAMDELARALPIMPLGLLGLRRRQPDDEAGAAALALGRPGALGASRGDETVLRPQPPAMGDHDLPRDVEAEPGILAEALLRPVGIEALENALEIFRRNARVPRPRRRSGSRCPRAAPRRSPGRQEARRRWRCRAD